MFDMHPHEVTAEKVIKNRLNKSQRLYRTIAGIGIATGVAAGIAANTDHTASTYVLLTAGVAGTSAATSAEKRKTRIICDENIKEIAYLNRKDVLEAHKSPYSSDEEDITVPKNKVYLIEAATLGSFLVTNAMSDNGSLDVDTLDGAPGILLGATIVGLVIANVHIKVKLTMQEYQSQLFNLSLAHDSPNIER